MIITLGADTSEAESLRVLASCSPELAHDFSVDTDSSNPFNDSKKVKRKTNGKAEAIVDLMMRGLEIQKSEIQERKKEREAFEVATTRAEERELKLVDLMELLVKHLVQE